MHYKRIINSFMLHSINFLLMMETIMRDKFEITLLRIGDLIMAKKNLIAQKNMPILVLSVTLTMVKQL